MSAETGINPPATGAPGTGPAGTDLLTDDQIPQWDDQSTRFIDSPLRVDSDGNIRTNADFISTGTIESGLSTFRLSSAHSFRSAGENIAFTNLVTGSIFHPAWQTTRRDGNWLAFKRTPTADLINELPIQSDQSQTITNPNYEIAPQPENYRIYDFVWISVNQVSGVTLTAQEFNGTEFVDYWRSTPFDLPGGNQRVTIPLDPFVDIFANERFRFFTTSEDDVMVLGNAAGEPFELLNARPWEDRILATRFDVGNLSIRDTTQITADVQVSVLNQLDFNQRIWIATTTGHTVSFQGTETGVTYFGMYLDADAGTLTVSGLAGTTFNGESTFSVGPRELYIFALVAENTFIDISKNNQAIANQITRALPPPGTGGATSEYQFIDTLEITADTTITAANSDDFNRRIWLITGASHTVTINEGTDLTYFSIYVRRAGDTGTIVAGGADVRINGQTQSVFEGMQSATFFAVRQNRFQEVFNNFRPAGFVNLDDTPAAFGSAGQIVTVNPSADGLIFTTPPAGTFAGLSDTPAALGTAGQVVTVNPAADGLVFDAPPVRAFTGLSDTPTALGTAGQVPVINQAANGLVFDSVVSNNWDVQPLPNALTIPTDNRRFYVYTGESTRVMLLPQNPSTVLENGWHAFFYNDSFAASITVGGDYRDNLGSIVVPPKTGQEIVFYRGGPYYVLGANIENLPFVGFDQWSENPLTPDTEYTNEAGNRWTSGDAGVNLAIEAARAHVLNREVIVMASTDSSFYIIDLPLASTVQTGSGFGFINQGGSIVRVRARTSDRVTVGGAGPGERISMMTGSQATIIRSGANTWDTVLTRGTVTR